MIPKPPPSSSAVVKTWAHSKEIDSLVIATDAGREGELVRWIRTRPGFTNLSSERIQTDKAIREGFATLKDGGRTAPCTAPPVCRAEADWLVGLNVTRAMTLHTTARSCPPGGADPTLALIVRREEEIAAVPKDY